MKQKIAYIEQRYSFFSLKFQSKKALPFISNQFLTESCISLAYAIWALLVLKYVQT